MSTNSTYLVRKGKDLRDTLREKRIQINPPAASAWLPPVLTSQPFVVPRGEFAAPLDIEGLPINVRIRETSEIIQIYPEFRIRGVEEGEGGKLLAEAVFHRYDEQIPAVRERLDGIFRARLGVQPEAEELEAIALSSYPASDILRRRIVSELGLMVEWTLQPDPATSTWLADITSHTPAHQTLTFNEELATKEFKLSFSVTVERASLSHVHRVQRRARLKNSAQKKIEELFKRIHRISNPAFKAIWTGINVWNRDLIRELAKDGFANVVAERISQEFGYRVKFSDFTPEANRAAISRLKDSSPMEETQRIFQGQKELYLKLNEKRQELLLNNLGNFEEIEEVDKRIARAKEEMDNSRGEHLTSDQKEIKLLEGMKDVVTEDLRLKFTAALRLEDTTNDGAKYGPKR